MIPQITHDYPNLIKQPYDYSQLDTSLTGQRVQESCFLQCQRYCYFTDPSSDSANHLGYIHYTNLRWTKEIDIHFYPVLKKIGSPTIHFPVSLKSLMSGDGSLGKSFRSSCVKFLFAQGPSIIVNIFTYDNSYHKRGEGVKKC